MLTPDEVIQARYTLITMLGQGGFGQTWLARDAQTGQEVVLKRLDMRRAQDWKSVELFEREAHVLKGLRHEAIPRYLDDFRVERGGQLELYLVQERAPGESLERWIERRGWRPSLDELREVTAQLLRVLIYLHELSVPVIHRDIKPQNLLRDESGRVSLVDFGAVKSTRQELGRGSTVAGTFGYMAPEQLRGVGLPQTDLYGVGATLLYLLTHQDPSALPVKGLAIDVRAVLSLPEPWLQWLERCLAPDFEARFASAREALAALEAQAEHPTDPRPAPTQATPSDASPPEVTRVQVQRCPQGLTPDQEQAAFKAQSPVVAALGVVIMAALGGVAWAIQDHMLLAALLAGLVPLGMMIHGGSPAQVIAHPRSRRANERAKALSGALMAWMAQLIMLRGAILGLTSVYVAGVVTATLFTFFALVFLGDWLLLRHLERFTAKTKVPWIALVENDLHGLRALEHEPGRRAVFTQTPDMAGTIIAAGGLWMLAHQGANVVAGVAPSAGWGIFAAVLLSLGVMVKLGGRAENAQRCTFEHSKEDGLLWVSSIHEGKVSRAPLATMRVRHDLHEEEPTKTPLQGSADKAYRVEVLAHVEGSPQVIWAQRGLQEDAAYTVLHGLRDLARSIHSNVALPEVDDALTRWLASVSDGQPTRVDEGDWAMASEAPREQDQRDPLDAGEQVVLDLGPGSLISGVGEDQAQAQVSAPPRGQTSQDRGSSW